MKREDLFLAIGEVEGRRLLRSELTVQEPSAVETKEEPVMKKKRVNVGRIIRNVLVAALIVSILSVTAYAAVGYLIFDSPEEMITRRDLTMLPEGKSLIKMVTLLLCSPAMTGCPLMRSWWQRKRHPWSAQWVSL